jgi:hypothetical protein
MGKLRLRISCRKGFATIRFISEKNPHFTVVNVQPGYVLGPNALIEDAEALVSGSNALVLSIVKGAKGPVARPGTVSDVRDVARVHVESLDEKKVVGNRSFVLDVGNVVLDDANEIVRKAFPEAAEKGLLPLDGTIPAVWQKLDVRETVEVFGKLRGYEESVRDVVGQYLQLKAKAQL